MMLCLSIALVTALPRHAVALTGPVVEHFKTICSAQVQTGVIADKSGFDTMSPAQIVQLATNLGFETAPEAVWVDQSADWFQIQMRMSVPEDCQIMSLQVSGEAATSAWRSAFSRTDGWRLDGPPRLTERTEFNRTYAYAARPVEGGFLQAFLNVWDYKAGATMLLLSMIKTGDAQAACDLWPEECN